MFSKQLRALDRDCLTFTCICDFMLENEGLTPSTTDLASMAEERGDMPEGMNVSTSTIHRSLARLEKMNLVTFGNKSGGRRSSRNIRVKGATFHIDLRMESVREAIRIYHEALSNGPRNTKE